MNNNIYKGSIQPNPKEYKIWIDDNNEIKVWNGGQWNLSSGSSSGAGSGAATGIIEITYDELVALRDNAKLIPGMMYRMTDYETTTSQEGTQAAGHPFDLILTALDEKTIDDKCTAIHSKRDTDGYFSKSNLLAWQVWYTLDNTKHTWGVVGGEYIVIDDGALFHAYKYGTLQYEGKTYVTYKLTAPNYDWFYAIVPQDEEASIGKTIGLYYEGYQMVIRDVTITDKYNKAGGKGVIYRLVDEYCNDAGYDFKNILLTKDNTLYYTFNGTYNGTEDITVLGEFYSTNNKIAKGETIPCIVFEGICRGNIINDYCDQIFLLTGNNNIFSNECTKITLGAFCNNNTFGYRANRLTFDNDFSNMIIRANVSCIDGTNANSNTHFNRYIINAGGTMNNRLQLVAQHNSRKTIYVNEINNRIVEYSDEDIYNAIQATKN